METTPNNDGMITPDDLAALSDEEVVRVYVDAGMPEHMARTHLAILRESSAPDFGRDQVD